MLPDATRFFINGKWVSPASQSRQSIINPATERSIGEVALGGPADVEAAVIAAKQAFPEYAKTSLGQLGAIFGTGYNSIQNT